MLRGAIWIVVGGETLSGRAIEDLYARIAEDRLHESSSQGNWQHRDVAADYIERIASDVQLDRRLKVVVDAGCGPGGFIDINHPHAEAVIGFDLSAAIDSSYENHGKRPNVYLAQGDIFNPPLRRNIADRLYTFGVVQHTPDPEGAFRSLIPIVKEGGEIAVWVYRKTLIPQPTYLLRAFTRGMREPAMRRIGEMIAGILKAPLSEDMQRQVQQGVRELAAAHPLYPELRDILPPLETDAEAN